MKKIKLFIVGVLFSSIALAQPVSDMGVIPIGVTLNSILRLNIVKGGNIEFVVNTFDQFEKGIAASAAYETDFNVASSVNFDVNMYAESVNLMGQVDATNLMSIQNIGYTVSYTGTGGTAGTHWTLPAGVQILKDYANLDAIVTGATATANPSAGNITKNAFKIAWQLSTPAVLGHADGFNDATNTLLAQNLTSDRYVVNVFLNLAKK